MNAVTYMFALYKNPKTKVFFFFFGGGGGGVLVSLNHLFSPFKSVKWKVMDGLFYFKIQRVTYISLFVKGVVIYGVFYFKT